MLYSDIKSGIINSLKQGDKIKVETLRFIVSNVRYFGIEKYGGDSESKITDDDVISVIKKMVKTHKESIEAYSKAGRSDLVSKEEQELAVLEKFLPAKLSEEIITQGVQKVIDNNPGIAIGPLMGLCMKEFNGQADGQEVMKILKLKMAK
jgi:uncharacterized protein